MIYIKNDVTENNCGELMEWDLRLMQISPDFYQNTNTFPIKFLRSKKKSAYSILHILYYAYEKLLKRK